MFNRLKHLLNPTPSPTHKIVRCETRQVDSKDGPKFVIMIGADLYLTSALEALIHDLVERFKVHRMVSPPETSLLVITIIGPCNVIAAVWMARMEKADIGVGTATGQVSGLFHSILPEVHL